MNFCGHRVITHFRDNVGDGISHECLKFSIAVPCRILQPVTQPHVRESVPSIPDIATKRQISVSEPSAPFSNEFIRWKGKGLDENGGWRLQL